MNLELDARLAKQGDKEAFIRLVKSLELSLYRIARSILNRDEDCADAIQETILKAYHAIPKLKQESFVKTWMIRILINECRKLLGKRRGMVLTGEIPETAALSVEFDRIELKEAVEKLDDSLRIVITLHYFEDMSLKQVAAALELPEGTIKSRLHRARQSLLDFLQPKAEGDYAHGIH
ncbi:sigma-70 family RNA polymerase sigma factor [Paenibacillus oleatilyticus]|uniref:Sigma-70 family RNA polymerase sigma factor n=1 Tax=Paenibacillus oleatilyticus TaxID=2594886 RepID=A0ABV4V9Y3_9BACL